VKTWHGIRYLVEAGHQITLATYVRPDEVQHLPTLEALCHAVHAVPIQRSRIKDAFYLLRSLLTGRPFLVERDDLPEMRALILQLLSSEEFDLIYADQLTMAQFAFPGKVIRRSDAKPQPALIFDAHNAVWTILKRSSETARWFFRPILQRESRAIRRHEGELVLNYDHTLAVTDIDRAALLEAVQSLGSLPASQIDAAESRLSVIPIAVDTQALQPAGRSPESQHIVTLGTLHYPPNADGIRWFVREVYPIIQRRLPKARLTIIGKNPPQDFLELAAEQPAAITVTGYVPDLDPYMEAAAVMVVPVRAGGGMRVRILEAFARGMPVVTTTVGLEGIDAEPGVEVLVEDTPETFASAVMGLLSNPEWQAELALRGRQLAEQKYDWKAVLGQLDDVFKQLEIAGEKAKEQPVEA
jgi:glycosyltransferase involved in cell wall biosynthesis